MRRRCEADGGVVAPDRFVRAHRDTPPLLETVEAPLDNVAARVLDGIEFDRPTSTLAPERLRSRDGLRLLVAVSLGRAT